MKGIKVNKKILNHTFILFTYVLAAFPVLTFGIRSVVIIIWTILGVLCIKRKKNEQVKLRENNSKFLLLISVSSYIYLIISLIYTNNYDSGIKRLTQMLPLLIFPVIFYLNREVFDRSLMKRILWVFSISVIVFVFYQIFYSLLNLDYLLADITNKELISNNLSNHKVLDENVINKLKIRRFRNYLIEITNSHFTYQGLWIIFSVFFISLETFRFIKTKKKLSYISIPCVLVMIIWMFFMSTKMPIIAMTIAFFIAISFFKKIRTKTLLLFMSLSLVILILSYFIFTPLYVRFNEVIKTKFELPTGGNDIQNYNSVNVRNGIYYCSIDIIRNNVLFGTGVGDSQEELNKCYKDKIGAKIYTWTDYNTHNQYLYFFLSSGLIGFFLFIILIYIHWKKSIESESQIYLYFILIICLISLTENLLSRSDGVLFFAFFSGLFLFNLKKSE